METGKAYSINQEKETPLIGRTVERISGLNDVQEKYLTEVEDKLHLILNDRLPKTVVAGEKNSKPMSNDFLGEMNDQFWRMEDANRRLMNVIQHLSKIV